MWNVRERIIPKLGSSTPIRIDFPLTKVEKAVGRIDGGGLGVEQKLSFENTRFVIYFKYPWRCLMGRFMNLNSGEMTGLKIKL